MSTFNLVYVRGRFLLTSPDVEPREFASRNLAKDWVAQHHPGSPVIDIKADTGWHGRRSGKEMPADKQRTEFMLHSHEWPIGRIHEEREGGWFWTLYAPGPSGP